MIILDGSSLTLKQLLAIARNKAQIQIAEQSKKKVNKASSFVKEISEGKTDVYGPNTAIQE